MSTEGETMENGPNNIRRVAVAPEGAGFRRVRRSVVLTFLVLAVAAVAAGCGGSDDETTTSAEGSATAEWADGLCSAVSTWKGELSSIANRFTDPSSLTEDGLQSAADDAKAATDTFRDDLEALGTPDTESGDEIRSSVDELSTTVQTEADSIETAVGDVSSLADVPNAVTAAKASIDTMSTALTSTIATIEGADAQGDDQGRDRQLPRLREHHELRTTGGGHWAPD